MSDSSNGGIGFVGALFLLFLGLKLGGVIDWKWIWVFAPLWVPLIIVLIIFAFIMLWIWLSSEYSRNLRIEFAFPVRKKKKHAEGPYKMYDENANLFATYDIKKRRWWQIWKR